MLHPLTLPNYANHVKFFSEPAVGNHNFIMSYLFYADDVIFWGDWSQENVDNVVCILHFVHLTSGPRLNLNKSNLTWLELGDLVFSLLRTWLELQGGHQLFRNLRKDLPNGKFHLLSIGTRLMLLKAVLGSLGIYFFFIFLLPASATKKPGEFEGSDADVKKIPWVKWDLVMASRDKGGVDIGSLGNFNHALLQKWRWRYLSDKGVIPYSTDIRVLGDGCSIRFWYDI
uniref:Reverse transcriptase domain-containing protein n=1 Tax=Lactuca sativa TaxID=4236 RepID=A0A9R1X8N6_LACSA|nr:hypothetical protein LSAT_V11C500244990 [Lactuca sativa]